ncbi:ABC transporter permease [Sphingobacteriales bacterium UPWRP_1]|nr:ABC transporter permease [Sphingobacteriales bacterium TSM_CSM]PSJ73405.1 ABC transporter permease [Sphingobacteriales bacterium UPWRP_1]
MLHYIARRLLYGILVLLGVVVIVFWLFNGLGDPARLTLGQRADVATIEAVNKELGLDKPRSVQFIMYLNDVLPISLHENTPQNKEKYSYLALFGAGGKVLVLKAPYLRRSYQTKQPVTAMLLSALPQTIVLALTAMLFASVVGIVLGVFAAVRQFTWADNAILVGSVLGISQPSYFSGIILALIFGYWLGDYTGLNYSGGLYEINDLGEEVLQLKNLILPALALGIRPVSIIMQLTRSSMLDVLSQDYIRTAQAKGLGRMKIVFKHALRNALNPVITAISGWLAGLLAGAYFIEIIFDYKGLGYVTINALNNLDFPVAMGAVLFTASLFVVINLLVDIIYGILDPRVSYQH